MHSFRALLRAPGFSAAAIAAVALGTGAATLVFAVLYSIVLRPLPYRDPSRLAFIWIDDTKRNIHKEGVSYPTFLDWQAQNKSFEDIAVRGRGGEARLTGAEPERLLADIVSADFFSALGVAPEAGRVFTSEEENDGARVAVISRRLAVRRFGSASAALEKTVELDRRMWRVVGVMPAGYGIIPTQQDLWLPARKFPQLESLMVRRDSDFFMGIARLKPGVTFESAQADLNAIGARLAIAYPIADPEFGGYAVSVIPFARQLLGDRLPQSLWIALAAAGLVLLVACVNVANLFLVRGTSRQREVAIRSALGAPASKLISLQFVEGAILAAAGGAVGLLLAWLGAKVLPVIAPANLPRLGNIAIHPAAVAFAIAASTASALLFAAGPAWVQSRKDPAAALNSASTRLTSRASRLEPALVITEFAFAFVLIAGAGIFLHTLLAITAIDPGFETKNSLLFEIDAPEGQPQSVFFRALLDRLRQIPGVRTAGAITDFFIERNPDEVVTVYGRPTVSGEQVIVDAVSPEFLASIHARRVRGRFLNEADYGQGPPSTVVINETFAKRFFPAEDAIGQHIKFGTAQARGPWITIVGVVADLRRQGRERAAVCEAFGPVIGGSMDVVIRTSGRAEDVLPAVRSAIRNIDPNGLAYNVTTLDHKLAEYASDRRLQAWMIGSLSFLILWLAAIGAYGVMQHVVVQRRHELAIRMAMGATPPQIWRAVISRGVLQAAAGITAGIVLFAIVQRFLRSLIYGVSTFDPISLVGAAALLSFAGLLACAAPATIAARADPSNLLRDNP
jgi:predicted permease